MRESQAAMDAQGDAITVHPYYRAESRLGTRCVVSPRSFCSFPRSPYPLLLESMECRSYTDPVISYGQ